MWVPSNPASVRNSLCLNHRENLPTSMNFTSRSSARFSCEDWRKIPLCLWQVEGQISILKDTRTFCSL